MRSIEEIARRRLFTQHLAGAPLASPVAVVEWMVAVQAQDHPGAKWGIAQRTNGATDADVERAIARGELLRTHVLRPTWHVVRPADIRWLLALTGPKVISLMRSYDKLLGLSEKDYARSNAAIVKALERGKGTHLIRAELGAAIEAAGVGAKSTRLNHLVMRAELEGLVCSGAPRGKKQTYALLDERAPRAKDKPRDAAIAELTMRYLASHGPARAQDFAWWSGLSVAEAKASIASLGPKLESDVVQGTTFWSLASTKTPRASRTPAIHLLPNWDELVVAYRDHSVTLDDAAMKSLALPQRGLTSNVVTRDGRVIGAWRRVIGTKGVTVDLTLLAPLKRAEQPALDAASKRFGAFLGMPVTRR